MPGKVDFKRCGKNIEGWSYMTDEFPEQGPNETSQLHCLPGKKVFVENQVDLSHPDEVLTFGALGANMEDEHGQLSLPAKWVKTQSELRREYKRQLSEKEAEGAHENKPLQKKSLVS